MKVNIFFLKIHLKIQLFYLLPVHFVRFYLHRGYQRRLRCAHTRPDGRPCGESHGWPEKMGRYYQSCTRFGRRNSERYWLVKYFWSFGCDYIFYKSNMLYWNKMTDGCFDLIKFPRKVSIYNCFNYSSIWAFS